MPRAMITNYSELYLWRQRMTPEVDQGFDK
jgi:hypothetical protein